MMKKIKLSLIIIQLFCLALFTGCSEDSIPVADHIENSSEEGLPIQFIIFDPADVSTRSSDTRKTKFIEGDVIHIQADFTHSGESKSTSYGAMKLVSGKWQLVDGSYLAWPSNAIKGEFKAYYMPQANGVLQPGIPTDAVLLSKIDAKDPNNKLEFDADPLYADTHLTEEGGLPYGNAVELHFKHVCTHLTFENMDTGISDYFWLVDLNKKSTLPNSYILKLDESNQLGIEFLTSEGNTYGENVSYVSAKAIPYDNPEGEGNYSRRVKVSFFLKPGDYSNVELRTNTNTPYLSFKSEETGNLLSHTPYIVDAIKSKGISYTINENNHWDNQQDEVEVVVKDFIEAIVNGNDYSLEDEQGNVTVILEAIPNGVELRRSVRFPDNSQQDYDSYEGWNPNRTNSFSANIPAGRVFEGNYNYISNIQQPLFQYNSGTIQNLGLKDVDCEVVSKYVGPDNDYKADRSRRGALCQWNRVGGVIQNIRIENLSITVKIEGGSSIHTHSAGGICGENRGTISDVALSGDINITIRNNNNNASNSVDSEIPIGGIVGQNTGLISNISPLDESNLPFKVTVTNLCTGNGGVFSVGGAVGYNGSVIEGISLPNVTVDCTGSNGYQGYTGGLVGRLRGSSANNTVKGCTVSGKVLAGIVSDYEGMTDSYLYTGGLVGSCTIFEVTDCATTCSVRGLKNDAKPEKNSRYATGGIFGSILTVDGNDQNYISNLTGWNDSLEGPEVEASNDANDNGAYIGKFAGIVPAGKNWNDYSQKGITVKSNNGTDKNIGTSINIEAGGFAGDDSKAD